MENKLITTFKEYKETYETRLENHLAEYEDFDESHFIGSELEFHDNCLQTATVTEHKLAIHNKDYTDYEYKYLNNIEAEEIIEESKINCRTENYDVKALIKVDGSFLTDYYNLKTCEKLKISFTKIIEFLQEKKIICDKINEYQSNFMQPDATIIAMFDGIETPKVDYDKIRQSEKYLYLKETAKEYIEKYNTRLNEFLDENEADEIDYIDKQVEYFEYTLYDVQNSESSHDGYSTTGFDNFSCAYQLVTDIGYDKFMYSTKAKLKFLTSQKVIVVPQEKQEIESESENTIPYKIALLKEIGFFELDFIKKLTKENQYKLTQQILGGSVRSIKGNILVLNPNSTEDRSKYTSENRFEDVRNYLLKLK